MEFIRKAQIFSVRKRTQKPALDRDHAKEKIAFVPMHSVHPFVIEVACLSAGFMPRGPSLLNNQLEIYRECHSSSRELLSILPLMSLLEFINSRATVTPMKTRRATMAIDWDDLPTRLTIPVSSFLKEHNLPDSGTPRCVLVLSFPPPSQLQQTRQPIF
jgi:hypothetical protein